MSFERDNDAAPQVAKAAWYFIVMLVVSGLTTMDGLELDAFAVKVIYGITAYWGVVLLVRCFRSLKGSRK